LSSSIKIPKKYKPLFDQSHGKRYIIITGGRGSGKSFAASTHICMDIWKNANKRVLYTRYTMVAAEISIIPEFTEKIEMLGGVDQFEVKTKDIKCTSTGSDILFRGIKTSSGNQTAKLKSIQGVSTFVIDEAEEMTDEASFDKIDLSIRTNNAKNTVILILNPTTKEHWIYKRWFENNLNYIEIEGQQIPVSTHPDVVHIHTTYLDNLPHLDDSFLKQIERIKQTNLDKYRNLILGGWLDKAEGVIFENWKTGEFDESLPYMYGLDFGYSPDPTAMVRVAIDSKKRIIYLDECVYSTELSVDNLIQAVKNSLKSPRDMVVCDTNEKRTVAAMAKARINVSKALKYPGSVKDGIRNMQDYLMIVTPTSSNIIKELNNYVWNDKKSSVPVDDYNHSVDAARYGFARLSLKHSRKRR
jgi:phage terminase large subunit